MMADGVIYAESILNMKENALKISFLIALFELNYFPRKSISSCENLS